MKRAWEHETGRYQLRVARAGGGMPVACFRLGARGIRGGLVGFIVLLSGVAVAPTSSRAQLVTDGVSGETGILAKPARLSVHALPLETALLELQRTSGVSIAYSPSLLPVDRTVDCACLDVSVGEAIRRLLGDSGFEAVPMMQQLVIRKQKRRGDGRRPELPFDAEGAVPAAPLARASSEAPEESGPRSGRVVGTVRAGPDGGPVAGAQVFVSELGVGTLSDGAGGFSLEGLPVGRIPVRAEIIGYAGARSAVEVEGGETTRVDFWLTEHPTELDEIVVTGTAGGQQRRAVGNVVGALEPQPEMERLAPASLQQMLAGRVAGVGVQIGGGNVGTGGNVLIRGVGTLTQGSSTSAANTGPLVYIDGVRVNADKAGPSSGAGSSRLNDINPEDIERIEIIKGPAAATLYGTEASNGVIQIITKKGTTGRPTVTVSVRQGGNWFNDPDGRIPVNYGLVGGDIISQDLYAEELAAGRDMFRTGHIQNYNMSVSGGTSDLTYFLSVGRDDEQGYMLNNSLEKTSVRTNLGLTLSETFDVSADVGLISSDARFAPDGQGGIYGMFAMFLWGTPASRDTPSRGFMVGPPEAQNDIDFAEELNRGTASLTASHRPTSWLSHRLVAGLDLTDAKVSRFWPRVPSGGYPVYASLSDGRAEIEYNRGIQQTVDYNLTATFDLTSDITSATSFGAQYFTKERLRALAAGERLPSSAVSTVGAAAQTRADEDFVEAKSAGFFLQETLGWRDQLFVTAAVRGDAHSAFGETFDAVYYPKLSASWVVSDASFWGVDFVESLRLRAAWGKSGLQPDAFAAVRTYSPTTGPGDAPALLPGNLGNPDLKPEVGSELELGFDASLFSERLGLEFTFYNQTTSDAILSEIVAPSLGFAGLRHTNAGTVRNRGVEVEFAARPLESDAVMFDVTATAAYNSNELVSLGEGREQIQADTRGRFQHRVGYPLGGYWSKYIAGAEWNPSNPTELINIMCEGPEPARAPTPCGDAPFHYLGPPGPVWQGSVTNTLSLPDVGLTLTALWNYTWESRRFSTTTWQRDRNTRNSERAQGYLLGTLDPIEAAEIQTFDIEHPWMERDDHIRLRELALTYELPSGFVEGYGASRASITVSGPQPLDAVGARKLQRSGPRSRDPTPEGQPLGLAADPGPPPAQPPRLPTRHLLMGPCGSGTAVRLEEDVPTLRIEPRRRAFPRPDRAFSTLR